MMLKWRSLRGMGEISYVVHFFLSFFLVVLCHRSEVNRRRKIESIVAPCMILGPVLPCIVFLPARAVASLSRKPTEQTFH
ncbi:hypothetical protein BGX38DRAFT_1228111 [Terfezia claveryi]|nr:hypothetical protein BGX38DRAFT_1228111 [Terfezia claveryi]